MTARKSATATKNRRVGSAKALLNIVPHSTGRRGGLNFRSITNIPAVRYAAGGVAVYGLIRLAMKTLSAYPSIGEFFSTNLDTAEDKFRTWTGREESADMADAAH